MWPRDRQPPLFDAPRRHRPKAPHRGDKARARRRLAARDNNDKRPTTRPTTTADSQRRQVARLEGVATSATTSGSGDELEVCATDKQTPFDGARSGGSGGRHCGDRRRRVTAAAAATAAAGDCGRVAIRRLRSGERLNALVDATSGASRRHRRHLTRVFACSRRPPRLDARPSADRRPSLVALSRQLVVVVLQHHDLSRQKSYVATARASCLQVDDCRTADSTRAPAESRPSSRLVDSRRVTENCAFECQAAPDDSEVAHR